MIRIVQRFFQLEAASSLILLIAAVFAMILANSPFSLWYFNSTNTYLFLVNDGLMTVFFIVVGLELKRGLFSDASPDYKQIILPAGAALGGMLVPALLYILVTHHDSVALKGWSIPVATDIAFALGVLALFGSRVSSGLKLFLLSLAIFDDIGAILIIALFYSQDIAWVFVTLALLFTSILFLLNRFEVKRLWPYGLVGIGLWLSLLFAEIHPTLAGVLFALFIPVGNDRNDSPLHRLEYYLHPWVAYGVMPLFALANAGVSFSGVTADMLTGGVVLGTLFGLFVGKQVGVMSASYLLVQLRYAALPQNTTWLMLYGVALLCGIGFTMSLFLGTLSFAAENPVYLTEVRLGVMVASLLSGFAGALVLLFAYRGGR